MSRLRGSRDENGLARVVRYREAPERLIEGFASKAEAVDWIETNVRQVRE